MAHSLETDNLLKQQYKEFIEWASQYDDPSFNSRSLTLHNSWIDNKLSIPIVKH